MGYQVTRISMFNWTKRYFLRLNSNIIIFPAFPEVKEKKIHKKKKK